MSQDAEFADDELLEPGSPGALDADELVVDATEVAGNGSDANGETSVLGTDPGNDVTQRYLNDIGARPLLTPQQEFEFATQARAGDFDARQK